MNKTIKAVVAIAVAVILLSGGFIGGYFLGNSKKDSPLVINTGGSGTKIAKEVDEVNALLKDRALNPPSETSATAGAVQGLLDSTGDKYALYFDAKHYQYFAEDSMGEFGGIGVVLGEKDGAAYVVEVYKDTPAKKAGLKSGDLFSSIDGVTRKKWTTQEVVKRVRGKEGTKVKLTMVRPGEKGKPGKTFTVECTRAMIQLPNLRSSLKGDVGYIRLGQFNAKSAEDIGKAVKRLEKKGAKSFVLDLRDNPGGLLSEAVDVTSLFVKDGAVVRIDERGKEETVENVTGNTITKAPLVVLINSNSASASEIVGGALQDHKRATLVGEKSFGKGSVQTVEELNDGGAVKFTIAHYLTPKSRVIDHKGLTPDVVVKMKEEAQAKESTDIQLKRALQIAASEAR
ncbi:MAG TPA: S41 family peptidase [Coriobacteriia bacterium]|nr:S41 family peptidase [Coriobacteriia bacterium]